MTFGPRTVTSPACPDANGSSSSPTIRTSCPGNGRPTVPGLRVPFKGFAVVTTVPSDWPYPSRMGTP